MSSRNTSPSATGSDKPSFTPRALRDAIRKGYLCDEALIDAWHRLCVDAGLPVIILFHQTNWRNTAVIQVLRWSEPDPQNCELARAQGVKEVLSDQCGTIVWVQDRHSAKIARQLAEKFGTAQGRVCRVTPAPISSPPATQEEHHGL